MNELGLHLDQFLNVLSLKNLFGEIEGRGNVAQGTKGALSAKTAKLMVFKLVDAAAKTWRRLKGENQLPKVIAGIKFQNGIEVIKMTGSPRRLINLVTQSPA